MTSLSLEIVEGPDAGRQQALTGPVVVGRTPEVDLPLTDARVSRRHASIRPENGSAVIEDLGSSNGTFVNSQQLYAATRVRPGDEILLGVTVLALRTAQQILDLPSAVRSVPPGLAVPERQPSYVERANPPDQPLEGAADLQRLLDVHTKRQARTAPLAIFVVVTLVVLIYFATR